MVLVMDYIAFSLADPKLLEIEAFSETAHVTR